ncbi:unnamed protein product [Nippostrongylus brasiliensis]|uniref:Solute carrier family 28 member 3 n=1 Tax=Nippostrongylus brasiliensis TaxID=27835 RepID=A0A158QZ67_NIPBR|nr:unnamed protein product [Nippostrongylus brasiliensis]
MFAIGVVAFLIIDTSADRSRLLGLVGMTSFILLLVNWRTVTWGYSVQFFFGLLVLRWPWGSLVFQRAADLTVKFLQLTDLGSSFVYGYLAKPLPICEMEPVLAFSALQVLVFFGAVVSLLYYYSIIQWILKRMASFTQLTLGTTAVESLNACACVFLGQAESALLFGPYVEKQTASELHAIMTSGFSCIAGSLFAAYVSFGACPSNEKNPLECLSNGSMAGFHLVVAIAVNLVSVLALLGLVNAVVFYLGDAIGYETWSVENGLQYLVFPLAYIMGVSGNTSETLEVAGLISTKTVVNEFVAYRKLGEIIANNRLSLLIIYVFCSIIPTKSYGITTPLKARSAMIATYALCGFSNFCSVGIVLAVLGMTYIYSDSNFSYII